MAGDSGLDTIVIDPSIIPINGDPLRIDLQSTLNLTGDDLRIEGPAQQLLEINGMDSVRLIRVDLDTAADLQLHRLILADGQSMFDGGAIKIQPGVSNISLDEIMLLNNHSDQEGGAISTNINQSLNLTITDSTLSGNTAPRGGAISLTTTGASGPQLNTSISGSIVSNNTAESNAGGAVFILPFDASSRIELIATDSLFEMNTANDTGGAISAAGQAGSDAVLVHLAGNLFLSNFSNGGSGGAYRSVNLDTVLVNNTFIANQAEFSGGAISLGNTSGDRQTELVANTFYENIGGAGAPFTVAKELTVSFMDTAGSINRYAANLIASDLSNASDDACALSGTSALTDSGFNVSNDADCVTAASDTVQSSLRLVQSAGPTPRFPLIIRPLPGSIAIEHWPDAECELDALPLQTDMIGLRRDTNTGLPMDGDADLNFDCDSGAIEAATAERLDILLTGTGGVYEVNYDILCNSNCTMAIPADETAFLLGLPAAGNRFDQWTDDCAASMDQPCTLIVDEQKTVGAQFLGGVMTSVLNVSRIGDGLVTSDIMGIHCGAVCRGIFTVGETVTLTATSQTGSVFTGWSGVCSGTGTCQVTIDDQITQTAVASFVSQDYPLMVSVTGSGTGTVTSTPGGIDCAPDCSEDYPAGSMVELIATASGDDLFFGFSGDCSGTGSCVVNMDQARAVTADFRAQRTLDVTLTGTGRVTSDPAAIDCPGSCSVTADQFSTFVLTAEETDAQQFFIGWQGDCTPIGDGTSCQVALVADRSVTARFGTDMLFADGFE